MQSVLWRYQVNLFVESWRRIFDIDVTRAGKLTSFGKQSLSFGAGSPSRIRGKPVSMGLEGKASEDEQFYRWTTIKSEIKCKHWMKNVFSRLVWHMRTWWFAYCIADCPNDVGFWWTVTHHLYRSVRELRNVNLVSDFWLPLKSFPGSAWDEFWGFSLTIATDSRRQNYQFSMMPSENLQLRISLFVAWLA